MNVKILRNALLAGILLACVPPALTRAQSSSQNSGQNQAAPSQNAAAGPNLDLTADQQAQMKQIQQEEEAQIKVVESDSSLSAAQKQEQIRQIRENARKQEEALLTPEQQKILEQWRLDHQGQRQGSRR